MDSRSTFTNIFLAKDLELRLEAWERIKLDSPSGLILVYILDTSSDEIIKNDVCKVLISMTNSKVDLAFIIVNCTENYILDEALDQLFSKSPTSEELAFLTSLTESDHVKSRIIKFVYYQELFSRN